MKTFSRVGYATLWLAVIGQCIPVASAAAQDPLPSAPKTATTASVQPQTIVRDIALAPDGMMTGQVLDANRRPVPHAKVDVVVADATVATTFTDTDGVFAVKGLRGGVHQVVTPQGSEACRLWAPGTAPPCAQNSLNISAAQTVVRGQGHDSSDPIFNHVKPIATHPLVVGGLLAAAIAIPASLNNADGPPGS